MQSKEQKRRGALERLENRIAQYGAALNGLRQSLHELYEREKARKKTKTAPLVLDAALLESLPEDVVRKEARLKKMQGEASHLRELINPFKGTAHV